MKQLNAIAVLLALHFSLFDIASLRAGEIVGMFTEPTCALHRYSVVLPTIAGGTASSKPKNVYCLGTDVASNQNNAIIEKFSTLFSKPIDSIDMAFFALVDGPDDFLAKLLCGANFSENAKISLMYSNTQDGSAPAGIAFQKKVSDCTALANPSVSVSGKAAGFNTSFGAMHLKLMIVHYADGSFSMAFGSGNPGLGLRIHFDNWTFYSTLAADKLVAENECIFEAAKTNSFTNFHETGDALRNCRKAIPAGTSNIRVDLLPFDQRDLRQKIHDAFLSSKTLDMAMSLIGDTETRDEVAAIAHRSGTKVRLLLDDDAYWSGEGNCAGCFISSEEVANWVTPLEDAGVEIKYLETANQHCAGNFLHDKFFIATNDTGATLFTGALNTTHAAFTSNVENEYISSDPAYNSAFEAEFNHMWSDLATSRGDMTVEFNPVPVDAITCN
ncbi:phospholipase D-like domain-containing protein [Rhizobium leguminosarum]